MNPNPTYIYIYIVAFDNYLFIFCVAEFKKKKKIFFLRSITTGYFIKLKGINGRGNKTVIHGTYSI